MSRLSRLGVASAVVTALAIPAVALGQAQAPTLKALSGSSFPDRQYLLQFPDKTTLNETKVTVTENGGPVSGLSIDSPGGSVSGVVLLIDASNSMKGAPINGAMAAARAFMAERKKNLPVAVVYFNPSVRILSQFSTDQNALEAAVSKPPKTAEGTHIYEALILAAEMAQEQKLARTTVVLLSDGANYDTSKSSLSDALEAASGAHIRVISVGLTSDQYTPDTLKTLAQETEGTYIESATPKALAPIYAELGERLSSEYLLTYRSLLPPKREADLTVAVAGFASASASYTTPALNFTPGGTFERSWIDDVIVSPWLMVFVIVAVLALIAFAILTGIDVRNRSLRRRMAQYVTVPTEEESRARRAEVTAMLAETAQRRIGGLRSWQQFEQDVELGGFTMSPLAIAGWTIVGGIAASFLAAAYFQSLGWLLIGLLAPFVTRFVVARRVRKRRDAFAEQLPDNLDVLAGAMRTGHSVMGALSVMVESADEPSKAEFRRVVQDEQLGVPLDDALMVMAHRMQSQDAEQVAMVMRLQREAGGNTAEVLDRVAETVRGRMELRRLVAVLTAQARISRWILTSLPIFLLLALMSTGGDYLDPLLSTLAGRIFLVIGAVMITIGSLWIKQISKLDV